MSNLMGILVSGTHLAITCVVELADGCVFGIYAKMWGLYAHVACCPCELY